MSLPELRVLAGRFGVCRLDPSASPPGWLPDEGFVSITRTEEELSIVCEQERIPGEVRCERDWRVVKLLGPFGFDEVGVLSPIASALAGTGVSILAIATYDTDYVLIQVAQLPAALETLATEGYRIVEAP